MILFMSTILLGYILLKKAKMFSLFLYFLYITEQCILVQVFTLSFTSNNLRQHNHQEYFGPYVTLIER